MTSINNEPSHMDMSSHTSRAKKAETSVPSVDFVTALTTACANVYISDGLREDIECTVESFFAHNPVFAGHGYSQTLNDQLRTVMLDSLLRDAAPLAVAPYLPARLSDGVINDITLTSVGKWPSFEAQSWACKVAKAVMNQIAPAAPKFNHPLVPAGDDKALLRFLSDAPMSLRSFSAKKLSLITTPAVFHQILEKYAAPIEQQRRIMDNDYRRACLYAAKVAQTVNDLRDDKRAGEEEIIRLTLALETAEKAVADLSAKNETLADLAHETNVRAERAEFDLSQTHAYIANGAIRSPQPTPKKVEPKTAPGELELTSGQIFRTTGDSSTPVFVGDIISVTVRLGGGDGAGAVVTGSLVEYDGVVLVYDGKDWVAVEQSVVAEILRKARGREEAKHVGSPKSGVVVVSE